MQKAVVVSADLGEKQIKDRKSFWRKSKAISFGKLQLVKSVVGSSASHAGMAYLLVTKCISDWKQFFHGVLHVLVKPVGGLDRTPVTSHCC